MTTKKEMVKEIIKEDYDSTLYAFVEAGLMAQPKKVLVNMYNQRKED